MNRSRPIPLIPSRLGVILHGLLILGGASAWGQRVVVDDPLGALVFGGQSAAYSTHSLVAALPEFDAALRVETTALPDKPYYVQCSAKTTTPVLEGQRMRLAFFTRALSSTAADGLGRAVAAFQQAGAPYTASGRFTVSFGPDWTRQEFFFRSLRDFAPAEANLVFQFGFDPQVVEIAGVELLAFDEPNHLYPVDLLGPDALFRARLHDPDDLITTALAPATGEAFASAVRFDSAGVASPPSRVQVICLNTTPVAQGEWLALTFHARTLSTAAPDGRGQAVALFERAASPYTKSFNYTVRFGAEWTRFCYVFECVEDYGVAEAKFDFQLGFGPQSVEIGGLELVSLGRPLRVETGGPGSLVKSGAQLTVSTVAVSGQPFTQALRAVVGAGATNPGQAKLLPANPFFASDDFDWDDHFLLTFWARATASAQADGRGRASAVFINASNDKQTPLDAYLRIDSDWRQYKVPFRCAYDLSIGGGAFTLELGYGAQTIELADLRLGLFGHGRHVSEFPVDINLTYDGRAPDAAWRAQAAAMIRQHRKAALEVEVIDAAGRPVPGARVDVTMTRPAFPMGSNFGAQHLAMTEAEFAAEPIAGISWNDLLRLRAEFERLFTLGAPGNDLKITGWDSALSGGSSVFKIHWTLGALEWLKARGMRAHGHVMVWPGYDKWSAGMQALWDAGQFDAARQYLLDSIAERATSTGLLLDTWDVLNEPFTNHDLMDQFGDAIMVEWFQATRDILSTTPLYINDFQILASGGTTNTTHQNHYYNTIQYLVGSGAPIDGIGLQSHFSGDRLTPPAVLWEILDRFGAFGLALRVSELDIGTYDESLDADYLRDFLTALYAWPGVVEILQWGFWEQRHWRPERGLYRRDWTAKPAGEAYEQLALRDWWTRDGGFADEVGRWTARDKVFKGRHTIMASDGSATATLAGVDLTRDQTGAERVVIQLRGADRAHWRAW